MRCSKCNCDNPADAVFCTKCGAKVEGRCASCKTLNPVDANFCRKCGAALASSSASAAADEAIKISAAETAPPEGERKTVSALFADIKGSMELIEDLDPEEARAIVDPALKLMIDAVHHYDGYIVQSTGDGIFALFGAPVAHEDHPQRALYASLRMQEQLKRYSDGLRSQGRLPLQARVGLNTGEVVVRSIATDEGHAEYAPIGHSTSLAARMQALAPVGSIAATDATRKLGEGYFTFRALGPTVVKGVSGPVNVYEVTGLGPLRTRLQRSAGRGLTKFVGREREIEALKHAAHLAHDGRGQIVAAVAEAGVGKSRLFFEFKAVAQSEWMVLEAFSLSHGKATAYLPLLELLRDYFRISADDGLRTRREKVTGRLLALDRALEDALPYLFALLGLSGDAEPLAQMDAQLRRRRIHEAIKRILLRESLNQPLIVSFEDLHWIDGETQTLLNLLVDSIGTARMLMLVNYRPEYRHEWGGRTCYTQLRLDPLGRESAEDMLRSLLGEEPGLSALKQVIIQRTDGNPFFMEETVQVLLDEGALVRNGGLKLSRPLGELKIPPTVQAILAARIDRLSRPQKELLQTLAVVGKDFALELAKGVTGKTGEEIEPMLSDLQLGEFIYEQPTIGGPEYTFKHALTQEVAYTSLLAERRRAIHEQTARAIEALSTGCLEDHYGELAHHCLLGNAATKALSYARLAAEQAVNRAAYSEAASMVEAALNVLDKLPDRAQHLRAELALGTIECTVAFVVHGASSPQRERAIRRTCELGEKTGEKAQLLRALVLLAQLHFTQGEAARGLALGRRCLELSEGEQEARVLADTHWVVGLLAESCGELRDAVSNYEEAVRCSELAQPSVSVFGILFRPAILCHLSAVRHLLGQVAEAARLAEEGIRRARESKHLFTLGHALTAGSWLLTYRREPQSLLTRSDEAIELSEQNGFAEWLHWGRFHRGAALAGLGRLAEGVADMEAGVKAFRRLGGVPHQQYAIAVLAQGYAGLGRVEDAITTLNEAVAHVERGGERVNLAEMLRLKGEILLIRNASATAEAERCFRAGLEVARAQSAKWWELRATVSLARLLRDTGRRDEARAMLAEIYGWFTEGFDTAGLKEAKALLDELATQAG